MAYGRDSVITGSSRLVFLMCCYCVTVPFPRTALALPPRPTQRPDAADAAVGVGELDPRSPVPKSDTPEDLPSPGAPGEVDGAAVSSTLKTKQCRPCKSGYYRPTGGSGGMWSTGRRHASSSFLTAPRRRSTDHFSSVTASRRRRRRGAGHCGAGRCRPCSECLSSGRVLANCSATQDTLCSPCRENHAWDPVRSRCKKIQPLIHEVFVEEEVTTTLPSGTLAQVPSTASHHLPAPGSEANHPRGRLPDDAKGGHLTEEARSDEMSAEYIASLFAQGSAGISIIVMVLVILFYFYLRFKRWKDERSYTITEVCLLLAPCFRSICNSGSRTVDDREQSSAGNRDLNSQERQNRNASRRNTPPASDSGTDGQMELKTVAWCKDEETRPSPTACTSKESPSADGGFMTKSSPCRDEGTELVAVKSPVFRGQSRPCSERFDRPRFKEHPLDQTDSDEAEKTESHIATAGSPLLADEASWPSGRPSPPSPK